MDVQPTGIWSCCSHCLISWNDGVNMLFEEQRMSDVSIGSKNHALLETYDNFS